MTRMPISTTGQFYDGKNPVPSMVQIIAHDDGLQILAPSGELLAWSYNTLREQSSDLRDDRMIISPADDPNIFLSFEHKALIAHVRAQASATLQQDFQAGGGWLFNLWMWLGALGVVVLLLIYLVIPLAARHIAPYVPYGFEQNLGKASEEALADILTGIKTLQKDDSPVFCEAPQVEEPLQFLMRDLHGAIVASSAADPALAERLQEVGVPSVKIVNADIVNAFALPGGRILVFRGLLERAVDNYDALGIILAHESAHVMERHNMRVIISDAAARIITEAIISGLLDSPEFGGTAEQILNAGYTLEMEHAADRLAVPWAKAIGIDPAEAVSFFEYILTAEQESESRMSAEEKQEESLLTLPGEITELFATHPPTEERIAWLKQHGTRSTIGDKYGDYAEMLRQLNATCPKP